MPNYRVLVDVHATAEFPEEPADTPEDAKAIVEEWARDACSTLNMDTLDIEVTVTEITEVAPDGTPASAV